MRASTLYVSKAFVWRAKYWKWLMTTSRILPPSLLPIGSTGRDFMVAWLKLLMVRCSPVKIPRLDSFLQTTAALGRAMLLKPRFTLCLLSTALLILLPHLVRPSTLTTGTLTFGWPHVVRTTLTQIQRSIMWIPLRCSMMATKRNCEKGKSLRFGIKTNLFLIAREISRIMFIS